MARLSDAELRDRLSRIVKDAADKQRLTVDASGQDALGGLVSRAAEVVDGGDQDQVHRAEQSFRRLAGALAAESADPGRKRRSVNRPGPPIGERHVEAALMGLCPGFWPFC